MNFIEEYQMEDPRLCDSIIEWFEQRKDLQLPGRSGTESQINLDIKVSTDITFEDGPLAREYNSYLYKFIEEYKKKYIYSDEGQDPWSVYPCVNIQRYTPGEYYKKLHCEHDGARGPPGRRHLVFMTYLNDVNDGGETFFYYQDLYVKPRKGLTLIWPAGWTHTHSGIVSNSEIKYIVTGWFSYEPHRPFLIIN